MPVAVGQAQTNTSRTGSARHQSHRRSAVQGDRHLRRGPPTWATAWSRRLTSKLQPLQNLVVIAKESARKFKDSEQSLREIGQALGTGTIVTGEIQTSGDKIQVNIQLIDANTEALGWGSTFTKTKDEFFDLQNEIATKARQRTQGRPRRRRGPATRPKSHRKRRGPGRVPGRSPRME